MKSRIYIILYTLLHRFTQAAFLSDFEDSVENVICGSKKRITLGDSNILTEDNSEPETFNLEIVINKCSLMFHHTPKTHQVSGINDLVISNEMSKQLF